MQFSFYPKHEHGCPHVGHCPHLGGAALGTLVLAASRQTEWTGALHRQVDALRGQIASQAQVIQDLTARNEQLQRELTAERQKQFKRKKEEPVKAETPDIGAGQGGKKRGAPVGHPGWHRKRPVEFDRLLEVSAPRECPQCGASVKARPDRPVHDHLQEDWIEGRRIVACYRHEAGRCRKCRRWVQQAGPGELLRAMLGPSLRATSLFLRYDIGLPTRKVVRVVAGLAQFDFVPASLLRFERHAARKAKPLAQDVAEKLRSCDANHADETHYRINGEHAFAWFHGNENLAHFHITATRSGQVSRTILGSDYQGGLVTDCYGGYDRHQTRRKQKCLAHLKRSAQDWRKLLPPEAHDSRAFFDAVTQWVKRGCKWHRTWRNDSGPAKDHEAQELRSELERLQKMPADHARAARLQKRLRRYGQEWLTFLDHPGISPTNNLAEQALRPLVILRKLTFGSRTQAGARRLGTMMTVIETAKRQGQDVVNLLNALLTTSSNQAMRAMYARP